MQWKFSQGIIALIKGCNFHIVITYLQFYLYPKPEEAGATFITKSNDLASTNAQRRVSYTVNPDVRVVMHWSEESLPTFNIRALGVRVYVL